MSLSEVREGMCVSLKQNDNTNVTLQDVFEYCSLTNLYESDYVLDGRGKRAMLVQLTREEQALLKGTYKVIVEPEADMELLSARIHEAMAPRVS